MWGWPGKSQLLLNWRSEEESMSWSQPGKDQPLSILYRCLWALRTSASQCSCCPRCSLPFGTEDNHLTTSTWLGPSPSSPSTSLVTNDKSHHFKLAVHRRCCPIVGGERFSCYLNDAIWSWPTCRLILKDLDLSSPGTVLAPVSGRFGGISGWITSPISSSEKGKFFPPTVFCQTSNWWDAT